MSLEMLLMLIESSLYPSYEVRFNSSQTYGIFSKEYF